MMLLILTLRTLLLKSQAAEFTPLDQMRELKTNINLAEMFEEHLRESRMSKQMIGIEVEKKSTDIVDWALNVLYGSIIPTELEDIYETLHSEETGETESPFEEIIGDLDGV